jgi:hypothetical protein
VHLGKLLASEGFLCASRHDIAGPGTLLAIRAAMIIEGAQLAREVRLIEVTTHSDGPFSGFGRAKRRDLWSAAEAVGATAWLAWRPFRSWEWEWHRPEDWPATPAPEVWPRKVRAVTQAVGPRRVVACEATGPDLRELGA